MRNKILKIIILGVVLITFTSACTKRVKKEKPVVKVSEPIVMRLSR